MAGNALFAEMSKDLHYALFQHTELHRKHSGISVLAGLDKTKTVNRPISTSNHCYRRALVCGSQCELPLIGSTSDIDVMMLLQILTANNNIDAWHSGFVKLLSPIGGKVIPNNLLSASPLQDPCVPHGPAILIPGDKDDVDHTVDTDFVFAIHCKQWPSQAEEWLHRPRSSGWPSQQQIKHIEEMGCHAVPIGHPKSAERDDEWRLSFSQAERYLVQSLDCNQLMSFVFAREVLSSIKVKDDKICSFYVKTVFFWLCEENPANYWKESTIVQTAVDVIKRLAKCLKDHCLPNYFVRNNNMIDHLSEKIVQASSERLLQALHTDSLIEVSVHLLKRVGFENSDPSHTLNSWSFDWLEQPMFHTCKRGEEFDNYVKSTQLISMFDNFLIVYERLLEYHNNMQRIDTGLLLHEALEKYVQITDEFQRLHLAGAMVFLGHCLESGIISAPADHFTKPWSQSMEELAELYRLDPASRRDAMSKCSKPGKLYEASLYMKPSYDSFENARLLYGVAMMLIPEIETLMKSAIAVSHFTQGNYLTAYRHIMPIQVDFLNLYPIYPLMLLASHPTLRNWMRLGKRVFLTCLHLDLSIAIECLLRLGEYEKADDGMRRVIFGCVNSAGIADPQTWLSWYLIFISFSVRWGKDWMNLLLSTKGNITQEN